MESDQGPAKWHVFMLVFLNRLIRLSEILFISIMV
jgi:hypothetical protein